MHYTTIYKSDLGDILLACDEIGLTGLWFKDQKYYAAGLSSEHTFIDNCRHFPAPLADALHWLNIYFSGNIPEFTPPLHLIGTSFQMEVCQLLLSIPYGKTTTYGEIASNLAKKRGLHSMSAQAVGGAVSKNPVSIIVPCHRVIGINGKLTGYAGGIWRKETLLKLENVFT